MKVIVLGAGVIGVSSAWFLAKQGHDVTVVDRQPGAGLETSFANGAQISVSQSEPWASPGAPFKVMKWLMQDDAPLLFRPKMEWHQLSWGMRFLVECRLLLCDPLLGQLLGNAPFDFIFLLVGGRARLRLATGDRHGGKSGEDGEGYEGRGSDSFHGDLVVC